jgi:hypothetical protein
MTSASTQTVAGPVRFEAVGPAVEEYWGVEALAVVGAALASMAPQDHGIANPITESNAAEPWGELATAWVR